MDRYEEKLLNSVGRRRFCALHQFNDQPIRLARSARAPYGANAEFGQ